MLESHWQAVGVREGERSEAKDFFAGPPRLAEPQRHGDIGGERPKRGRDDGIPKRWDERKVLETSYRPTMLLAGTIRKVKKKKSSNLPTFYIKFNEKAASPRSYARRLVGTKKGAASPRPLSFFLVRMSVLCEQTRPTHAAQCSSMYRESTVRKYISGCEWWWAGTRRLCGTDCFFPLFHAIFCTTPGIIRVPRALALREEAR